MRILWFSWKDRFHPDAGGAELVTAELHDRLARNGHSIILITASYQGAAKYETLKNGVEIYRTGNRYSVYLLANYLYRRKLTDWPDVVVDEMNTIPFLPRVNSKQTRILFNHQLAREVWFFQMPPPLSLIGYSLEPLMLRYMSRRYHHVITVSESTRKDLELYGFRNISTIREGITMKRLKSLPKKDMDMILVHGAIRPMKRTLDAVRAFEHARDEHPSLHLVLTGDASSKYATRTVLPHISHSRHATAIKVLGRVSGEDRLGNMQRAAVILVCSIKEGWGLIVTEANSQGTPAIAYNVDGLRDSIKDNETGLLCDDGNPKSMGAKITSLLSDTASYKKIQGKAWQWSKEFTFDNSYADFMRYLESAVQAKETPDA